MIPFENDNIRAYQLLLRIEIVLRECLRISFESEFGMHWQKRLPGDLLKKIKESQSEENKPQFNFIRLGPLYYLTIGELLNLLEQKSGRSVIKQLGGDCVLKQFENILAPRNAVCHSRPASPVGLKAIETLYAEVETALTADGLARLIAKPDTGLPQAEAAKVFISSLKEMLRNISGLPPAFSIPELLQTAIVQFWWEDNSLAGFDSSYVENTFALIGRYNELPKGVGSVADRLRFCQKYNLEKCIQNAIKELEKVSP